MQPGNSVLRVGYRNTFPDLVLFTCAHHFRSAAVQALFISIALVIFAVERQTAPVPTAAAMSLIVYLVMWLLQCVFNVIHLVSRSNRVVLANRIIEVREDGLYEETPYNQSLFFWSGVLKAVRRLGYIAIYVSPHQAHIIPRRAFASASDANSFLVAVKANIRAA